jgi:pyruvate/2-oxoglutarate dehydrogenase complex dihydrolipoamide acyltransferase (E2) component
MTTEVTLPVHDGSDNGEIARWLVKVGDMVTARQPIVAVDYEGKLVEIPAARGGRIARICADVGACVRTGSLLVLLD